MPRPDSSFGRGTDNARRLCGPGGRFFTGTEVYLVLAGSGVMRIDGDEVPLEPGRYVCVSAGTTRQPVAGPDGLSWVVVGAPPKDGWEPQL